MNKIKIPYTDLPEDLKEQIQKEIDSLEYENTPECLYATIIYSLGTVGSISRTLRLSFGLVMKIRDLNYLI